MLTARKLINGLSCLLHHPTPHPLHVQWFITSKCNYRCRYCGVWKQPPSPELNLEEVKRGIEALQELKVVELVFTGGNPLLRPDMAEILKYAHDRFPLVAIYDNGSLAWRKVEALRHADVVCISLDTLNPKLQDEINGVKGAFQAAMKSLETLKSRKVNVAVDVTVSSLNLPELPNLIEYFGLKGIPVVISIYTDFSTPDGLVQIGQPDPAAQLRNGREMVELLEKIRELRKVYPVHLDERIIQVLIDYFSGRVKSWSCKALTSFFVVDPLGRVSGCHLKPPIVEVQRLPEVWNSKLLECYRRKYAECDGCLYLCYLAYSLLDSPFKLFTYSLEYESYRFRKTLK